MALKKFCKKQAKIDSIHKEKPSLATRHTFSEKGDILLNFRQNIIPPVCDLLMMLTELHWHINQIF